MYESTLVQERFYREIPVDMRKPVKIKPRLFLTEADENKKYPTTSWVLASLLITSFEADYSR